MVEGPGPHDLIQYAQILGLHALAPAPSPRQALRHQALHDPLTDLANRPLLQDRLEHALARLDRHGGQLAQISAAVDTQRSPMVTSGPPRAPGCAAGR